jgi:hypothetical protein
MICWILLNPSTADEIKNDPTVERCVRRSNRLGYKIVVVANAFALRSTDPAELRKHADPVGPENDKWIERAAASANAVVLGWGTDGEIEGRGRALAARLAAIGVRPLCLGVTKGGQPRHPLYIGYAQALIPFPTRS